MLGTNKYNRITNSCATTVNKVLRAGGYQPTQLINTPKTIFDFFKLGQN